MLKKRIIPTLLLCQGRLVKGVNFQDYRDVGDPVKSASVYNSQLADELIILNTEAEKGIEPLLEILQPVLEECFMPLTLGGGITSFAEAAKLIECGADKVALNSVTYTNPEIIIEIADTFGAQAVVCIVDVRKINDEYVLFSGNGEKREPIKLQQHLETLVKCHCGEVVIQSIDNDGRMDGFDKELTRQVCSLVNIPVISSGGSGSYQHLLDVFNSCEINGVVCGSLFNFSDSNPIRAKAFLKNHGIAMKNQ